VNISSSAIHLFNPQFQSYELYIFHISDEKIILVKIIETQTSNKYIQNSINVLQPRDHFLNHHALVSCIYILYIYLCTHRHIYIYTYTYNVWDIYQLYITYMYSNISCRNIHECMNMHTQPCTA
jgi:hypothetical protein